MTPEEGRIDREEAQKKQGDEPKEEVKEEVVEEKDE